MSESVVLLTTIIYSVPADTFVLVPAMEYCANSQAAYKLKWLLEMCNGL